MIATLVTRADMAADIVQALVGETLASLPELAVRAPVLAGLDPAAMREHRPAAPLHPGAPAASSARRAAMSRSDPKALASADR